MTKKDFILIAETVRSSTLWWLSGHLGYTLAIEMANMCATTSPLFDRERFMRACIPAGMDGIYVDFNDPEVSNKNKKAILCEEWSI